MDPYLFTGVLLPERSQLTVQHQFDIEFSSDGKGFSVHISIILSNIAVLVHTERNFNIFYLTRLVKSILQTKVASIGVLLGRYYDVQIDRVFSLSRGIDFVFENEFPEISNRLKYQDKNHNFTEAFYRDHQRLTAMMAGRNGIFIHRCLNDLTSAMRDMSDTEFYCYRALESLAHHCAECFSLKEGKISNRDEKWQKFREFSSTSKDVIMRIKSLADPLRHGHFLEMNVGGRGIVLEQTLTIFHRYVEKYHEMFEKC